MRSGGLTKGSQAETLELSRQLSEAFPNADTRALCHEVNPLWLPTMSMLFGVGPKPRWENLQDREEFLSKHPCIQPCMQGAEETEEQRRRPERSYSWTVPPAGYDGLFCKNANGCYQHALRDEPVAFWDGTVPESWHDA